jgi:hypothetical protein
MSLFREILEDSYELIAMAALCATAVFLDNGFLLKHLPEVLHTL